MGKTRLGIYSRGQKKKLGFEGIGHTGKGKMKWDGWKVVPKSGRNIWEKAIVEDKVKAIGVVEDKSVALNRMRG